MGRKMKKISIVVPCYNEEENVLPLSNEIRKIFHEQLKDYQYEIIFHHMSMKLFLLIMTQRMGQGKLFDSFVHRTKISRRFLMPKILGNLIRPTMECCNQQEMPPY